MSSRNGANRNQVKYQVFQFLHDHASMPYGFTIYGLADQCPDATLEYLKTRLHIWHRAGLLTRRKVYTEKYGRRLYRYHLSDKGRGYYATVPKVQRDKAKAALERHWHENLAQMRAQWATPGNPGYTGPSR